MLHFNIIDETDEYIVVDKPPFLLVHPTKPDGARTLWRELRELLAFEIAGGGQISIVNRLDRETSGLVLVAKTAAAGRRFGLLMQRHRLNKEYLAIVWGWPEWEKQIIDAPLARQGKHRPSAIWLKQMIHPAGAPAQTEFRVEQRFIRSTLPDHKFSLIHAVPRTGRTHQIRVHLSSIGHPIVGDKIYGPDEQFYLRFIHGGWTAQLEQELLLPRHALHAAKLVIEGEYEWNSPLAADLAEFLEGRPLCRPFAGRDGARPSLIAIASTTPMVGAPDENASRFRHFRGFSRVHKSFRRNGTTERRISLDGT